jgi:hypothetical protein
MAKADNKRWAEEMAALTRAIEQPRQNEPPVLRSSPVQTGPNMQMPPLPEYMSRPAPPLNLPRDLPRTYEEWLELNRMLRGSGSSASP